MNEFRTFAAAVITAVLIFAAIFVMAMLRPAAPYAAPVRDRPPPIFIIEIERMPDPRDGRYMIHYSINGVPHTVFAPDAETRDGFLEWLLYLGLGGGNERK